jgi:hypothetical protein
MQVEREKRRTARKRCFVEATSRTLEVADGMSWGGVVHDISTGGLNLGLCFPFRPDTFLAVDLEGPGGTVSRSLICRVVHVHDHADGTWTLGCEFLKPLSDSDLKRLV